MTPLGRATLGVSAAFLLAAIVWPQAAEALLRVFVATLALGFVVVRVYRAALPSRTVEDFYSPFDASGPTRTTEGAAPEAIRELTGELGAADDGELAQRTAIPWTVRRFIREEASRRLTERHGLRLAERSDHPRVRSLISDATWLLIRPRELEPTAESRHSPNERAVPLSRLDLILDDLERL